MKTIEDLQKEKESRLREVSQEMTALKEQIHALNQRGEQLQIEAFQLQGAIAALSEFKK